MCIRDRRQAQRAAEQDPAFAVNVEALTAAQPKDLDASEIEVRLLSLIHISVAVHRCAENL